MMIKFVLLAVCLSLALLNANAASPYSYEYVNINGKLVLSPKLDINTFMHTFKTHTFLYIYLHI